MLTPALGCLAPPLPHGDVASVPCLSWPQMHKFNGKELATTRQGVAFPLALVPGMQKQDRRRMQTVVEVVHGSRDSSPHEQVCRASRRHWEVCGWCYGH